jgi:predicted transcriptional regulator
MKPRIGVYLSKRTAARLAAVAKRRGATKSALVEAALDHFLGSDDTHDAVVTHGLADLSGQIAQLDRALGIVSEIVALHARFHLAVTPALPAATHHAACKLGSARFDEFASQVERRVQRGTPLMQETIDRLAATKPTASPGDLGEGDPPGSASTAYEQDFSAPNRGMLEDTAAVQEDGSTGNFPVQPRSRLH